MFQLKKIEMSARCYKQYFLIQNFFQKHTLPITSNYLNLNATLKDTKNNNDIVKNIILNIKKH